MPSIIISLVFYFDLVETLLPVENLTGVLHVRLLHEFRCRSDGMLNWVSQIGRPSSWGVCKGNEYFTLHRYQPKKALLSHSGLTLTLGPFQSHVEGHTLESRREGKLGKLARLR